MNKYNEILKNWETPFVKTTDEAWRELAPKLTSKDAIEVKTVEFNWKPLVSVAAAAALIIGIVLFWPSAELVTYEVAAGNHQTISLPDQSIITLNAGSVVSFNDDWSHERSLNLNGEAFFEVIKGGKFSVLTKTGIVEVLGTSFNVFARGDLFRVQCNTGKVLVSSGKNQLEITPGNVAELYGNNLVLSQFDPGLKDWRSGEFRYENEPVNNVFDEIGRQFNVIVVSPNFDNRTYTGRFNNDNLEQALEMVCLPMSLKFDIQKDNQVIITEKTR